MARWKSERTTKIQKKLSDVESDAIAYFDGKWVHDWIH